MLNRKRTAATDHIMRAMHRYAGMRLLGATDPHMYAEYKAILADGNAEEMKLAAQDLINDLKEIVKEIDATTA